MLVNFRFSNYRSFKEDAEFSLVSDKITEHDNFVFTEEKYNLLRSSVLYGANASGKTNFFRALDFFISFIKNSHNNQPNKKIDVDNFKLSTETEKKPTKFEMIFIIKGQMYRYGYMLTEKKIEEEWLFTRPKTKEVKLFERKRQKIIRGNSFTEVPKVDEMTKENTLFLSALSQWNSETAKKIIKWFDKINVLHAHYDIATGFTADLISKNKRKDVVLKYLKAADIGIDDLKVYEKDFNTSDIPEYIRKQMEEDIKEKLPEELKIIELDSIHKKYNKNKEVVGAVEFNFNKDESEGTKKYFSLIGPIIDTLENGEMLFIDEIDTRLHPLIVEYIVNLFNNKTHNTKNAQIVFSTHNTNILKKEKLRRDQIWFVEKDRYGESNLYSLLEFKGIRKDASYNKDYLDGKYGAIPNIDFIFADGDINGD
jgi:hypothetical protein